MKKISLLLSFLFILVFSTHAYATNGVKLIGTGPSTPTMGGVGVAEPQDTGGIYINPAGITRFAPRFDIANESAIIQLELDTSPAPTFGNAVGEHRSEGEIFFAPHLGFTGKLDLEDHDVYYGFAMGLTSGLKADFKFSRIGAAANAFDKHAELAVIEMVPTIAYKPTEKLAIGISPVISFKAFSTDFANAAFVQTNGRDNYSYAWGGGFNIGAIYDINEKVSVGASYKSQRWSSDFHNYDDTVDHLDGPAEYIFGVAYKPNSRFLVETNAKFIHWRVADLLRRSPGEGGFGWRNQWVFGIGSQYQLTDTLKFRMGYNYGKTPIEEKNVFANALSSLISEHHLGLGFSYQVTEKVNVDLGYLHTFTNSLTDNGNGDAFSIGGRGTKNKLGVFSILFGVGYQF